MPSSKLANLSPFLLLIALSGCVSVTEGEHKELKPTLLQCLSLESLLG